jgi:type VI secretion system secreted protein Hcp
MTEKLLKRMLAVPVAVAVGAASAIASSGLRLRGKNSGGGDAGGGGGAGKVAFSTVKFAKLYDSASPKLFQRLASGQHIPSVTFSFRRPGADGPDFLTYKPTDVVVAGYEQGGLKERPLLEQVELSFAKVQISYTPAGGAPIAAGWDVEANTSA